MKSVFVTRRIPERGIELLKGKGYEVDVSTKDGVLSEAELITALSKKPYDAVLCLLTDKIGASVFDAAPEARIFANYAVGFDNIDIAEAKKRGIVITNTPDVLSDTVAEHTFALILAITSRIAEADRFVRAGKYVGWDPLLLLGADLKGKTLGIIGAGRIGGRVLHHGVRGFSMKALYHDVKGNETLERKYNARYCERLEELLSEADVVSCHVPLLPSTRHLINRERLSLMKKTAYLVNTSRGPIIEEEALVEALSAGVIRGAALDVFENEPQLAPGLIERENVVLTPHIASATEETRSNMSEIAARNIIAALEGETPPHGLS